MLCPKHRKLLMQEAFEDERCKLFALIVPHADHQYLTVVSEEIMIVNLAGDETVGSSADGVVK